MYEYFDAHSDTMSKMYKKRIGLDSPDLMVNTINLQKYKSAVLVFALFNGGDMNKETMMECLGFFKNECNKLSSFVSVCTSARYIFDENRKPQRLPMECMYNLTEEYESGGAGLTSCTEDYATSLDAMACGGIGKNDKRILSSKTVELMGTNHLKGKQCDDFYQLRPGYGYGLGVRTHIDKAASVSLSPIGEFGWDGAAGASLAFDKKYGIVNIALADILNDVYMAYSTSELALEYQNGNPMVRGKDAIRYVKLGDLIPDEN